MKTTIPFKRWKQHCHVLLIFMLVSAYVLHFFDEYSNPWVVGLASKPVVAPRREVLFVTALYGTYEKTLKVPANQSISARFVAFTDREDLIESPGWEVHVVKDPAVYEMQSSPTGRNDLTNNTHPFNKAKFFKEQFHKLPGLQGHRIAIWMDSTVHITDGKAAEKIKNLVEKDGRNIIVFEHMRGGSMEEEVRASLGEKYYSPHWGCCDQPIQNVTEQYIKYLSLGFKEHWWLREYDAPLGIGGQKQYGMWVTCFVAFDMHKPISKTFLDTWWQQNVEFTTQDQVSFPFVAWKLKVYPFSLPVAGLISGNFDKNDLFIKMNHGLRN